MACVTTYRPYENWVKLEKDGILITTLNKGPRSTFLYLWGCKALYRRTTKLSMKTGTNAHPVQILFGEPQNRAKLEVCSEIGQQSMSLFQFGFVLFIKAPNPCSRMVP